MRQWRGRSGWDGSYSGVEEEEDEVLVVQLAHTVPHPRAVVVHPQDALPADAAVVHAGLLHQVALETVRVRHLGPQRSCLSSQH